MNFKVLHTVFWRNFFSYFANPTGYVFICGFVLLSSVAAFWPNEFFNSNLANLDQLNTWFPLIMLVFVPAIAMSVWAEERRDGTDELLLTIPASDFDIVLGKYLAAVAIYSVSLLFSLISNFIVLEFLGDPDAGLFVATYVGYWLVGLTMLAVAMVASFLTRNLTVAYVLGAAFNAPLVFGHFAEMVTVPDVAIVINRWSIGGQFHDFGRGILSFSGLAYFAMIVVVMLYVSMVLIGRRHWRGRYSPTFNFILFLLIHAASFTALVLLPWWLFYSVFEITHSSIPVVLTIVYFALHVGFLAILSKIDSEGIGAPFTGHYFLRTLLLAMITLGTTYLFFHNDLRFDVTNEGLSRLSQESVNLLDGAKETLDKRSEELDRRQTIRIDSFVSPRVPQSYIPARLDLLAKLRELESRFGGLVEVHRHEPAPSSKQAIAIRKRFGIEPRLVREETRGKISDEEIFMGIAFSRGVETVVVPFIDRNVPAEYELVRSLCTVAGLKRKRLGIVRTPALRPGSRIVEELKKQYDVEFVDPSRIPGYNEEPKEGDPKKFDVILAVQPSMLAPMGGPMGMGMGGPDPMDDLIDAIRRGQPTAIFEDPFPMTMPHQMATGAPRPLPPMNSPQQMMQMQQSGMLNRLDKTGIKGLFRLLEIDDFSGDDGVEIPKPDPQMPRPMQPQRKMKWADTAVWQDYDAYPDLPFPDFFRKLLVVVGEGCEAEKPFSLDDEITSGLQQVMLPGPGYIRATGSKRITVEPLIQSGPHSGPTGPYKQQENQFFGIRQWDRLPYNFLDLRTGPERGYTLAARFTGTPKPEDEASTEKQPEINVVLVADLDMIAEFFFDLRDKGELEGTNVKADLDNVTFVLNALDSLAGDSGFVALRNRRPQHRELTRITERTAEMRTEKNEARDQAQKNCDEAIAEAETKLKNEEQKYIERLRAADSTIDEEEARRQAQDRVQHIARGVIDQIAELQTEKKATIDGIDADWETTLTEIQNEYKRWAVLLPPIPPLVLGLFVFIMRRIREREGVARERLR